MTRAFFAHAVPLARLAMLRLHELLGQFNNLLLLPLVILIAIDLASGLENAAHVELDDVSLLFGVTFSCEWLLGLILATRRSAYLTNVWVGLDIVSALPLGTALQALRLTRLARLLRLMRILRLLRSRGRRIPIERLGRAVSISISIGVAGALALQAIEPELLNSFGSALWWSVTTMTTVGYGDIVPQTTGGRLVAVALMMSGIGVFSYLAGLLATAVFDPEEDEILRTVRRLEVQLEALTQALEERPPAPPQR